MPFVNHVVLQGYSGPEGRQAIAATVRSRLKTSRRVRGPEDRRRRDAGPRAGPSDLRINTPPSTIPQPDGWGYFLSALQALIASQRPVDTLIFSSKPVFTRLLGRGFNECGK